MSQIALVTGAYRGLGLETCKQLARRGLTVLLSARKPDVGEPLAAKLRAEGLDVHFLPLDVSNPSSLMSAYHTVHERWKRLDVLVNNAAILEPINFLPIDANRTEAQVVQQKQSFSRTFETNVIGVFQLCDLFLPLMLARGYGRIVNVSSLMGQLTSMGTDHPAYRLSKVALNAATVMFALKAQGADVLVNAVSPGWVRTEMGGPLAPRSQEEGANGIVWAATLPKNGPNGQFFQDQSEQEW